MPQQMSSDVVWNRIVAKAWCDKALMNRLLSAPREVLAEHGMRVPEAVQVRVVQGDEVRVEDSDAGRHFTFPFSPPDELTEEDLVGGAVASCFSGACAACGACGRCACRCACRCRCF